MIVAHELHHNARWRGPGYDSTLLEAWSRKASPTTSPPSCCVRPSRRGRALFRSPDTEGYLERVRPLLDSTSFNRFAWFFGMSDLPNWTGYTLGYRLVERYQLANPGRSAADLVHTSANVFRP